MFHDDVLVSLAQGRALDALQTNQKLLQGFLHAAALVTDIPQERLINAIKDEVIDLNARAYEAIGRLQPGEATGRLHEVALELVQPRAAYFPRAELEQLGAEVRAEPLLAGEGYSDRLLAVVDAHLAKHRELERRLKYLLKPSSFEDIQKLDPVKDCDQIAHFVGYEFRTELKFIATLYELRALISAPMASFFHNTGEFATRSVRRIMDTTHLFNNMTEWGLDSKRGRACIERVNGIHGRYYIHNDSFRFVLDGILFVPDEFNSRLGWRRFTDVERLGWFHAYARLGRAMGIQSISMDWDEEKAWYEEYCRRHTFYHPGKRKLFDTVVCQVLAAYPEALRAPVLAGTLVGMDDVYRQVTGYPAPPPAVVEQVKAAFRAAGQLGAALPRIPFMRSMQSTSTYPLGYRIEDLGVARRSYVLPSLRKAAAEVPRPGEVGGRLHAYGNDGHAAGMRPIQHAGDVQQSALPEFGWEEIAAAVEHGRLWTVVAGDVYDLTGFVADHPGGAQILERHRGKDATEAYAKSKHSREALVLMLNYRVGRLRGAPPRDEHKPEATFDAAPAVRGRGPNAVVQMKSAGEFMALAGQVLGAVKALEAPAH
jgi:cytochrome b involved in lipid metabolism